MLRQDDPPGFDPESLYDQFPRGADSGFGPEQGYNWWIRINDPELFTEDARNNPVIREFLSAPFSVHFGQFKSSYRETEYFIHKPMKAMTGRVDGIEGSVPLADEPRISTLVLNHENTLAFRITRTLVVSDEKQAGQVIHKEGDGTA